LSDDYFVKFILDVCDGRGDCLRHIWSLYFGLCSL
jgi:hypothetical protein